MASKFCGKETTHDGKCYRCVEAKSELIHMGIIVDVEPSSFYVFDERGSRSVVPREEPSQRRVIVDSTGERHYYVNGTKVSERQYYRK